MGRLLYWRRRDFGDCDIGGDSWSVEIYIDVDVDCRYVYKNFSCNGAVRQGSLWFVVLRSIFK